MQYTSFRAKVPTFYFGQNSWSVAFSYKTKLSFFFFFSQNNFGICIFDQGCPDRTEHDPTDQTRPEPTHPRPIRELRWSAAGCKAQKPSPRGSDGGFFPLKPTSTDSTGALTKSSKIRISRRVFGQNTLEFYEIWAGFGEMSPNLVRSQLDLVEISPDLARSHQIR